MAAASVVALLGPGAAPPPGPESVEAATLPSGFVETTVFSGLTNPTVVRFASDGRVFVAEKSGLIKVFDNALRHDADRRSPTSGRTSTTSGIAGCSAWRSTRTSRPTPYVYVLYTYDHILGDTAPAPKWGTPGATSDGCPTPARRDGRRLRRERAALATAGRRATS